MKSEISDAVWVSQTLRLVQALLGTISENFRMVAISHDGNVWRLLFVLAEERADDREEIVDVGHEFEALQDVPIAYEIDVAVTDRPIAWPDSYVRVVYRRREI